MANLTKMERISLKNNQEIKEDMIQKFLFDDPKVLGLGELTSIQREKIQPQGGRLDLLFADDNNTRYEVEVQLGATDPSHIIRTIEYWDTEKKRYPQYDHCAVIVAEEITGRFMNVIQLFNGAIPLIAIQISAYKNGNDVSLTFTKIIDRVTLGIEDEEEIEPTDRNYWENRSTTKVMKNVDEIFSDLGDLAEGYELKYNKFYIGISKEGLVKNFIAFKPKKNYLYFIAKGTEDSEKIDKIENANLEVSYVSNWKEYQIRINNIEEYRKNRELIRELVKDSMEYYNI
ncbi:MAG: hypothetical protein IK057_02935 [Clostridia bacterium]|nr:hypothetical protein [Clostridia bacterium]